MYLQQKFGIITENEMKKLNELVNEQLFLQSQYLEAPAETKREYLKKLCILKRECKTIFSSIKQGWEPVGEDNQDKTLIN